tara:strand:+ start:4285 stop:5118 length:834 start_codon:yes stop_codon:yes gene_type:complete
MRISRKNTAGAVTQVIDVGIAYGPAQKVLARVEQDPGLDKEVAIQLPYMSFEITGINYAPDRAKAATKRLQNITTNDTTQNQFTYVPVPYDINFTLSIMAKFVEDASQIVEMILPFFTPSMTLSLKILPGIEDDLDVPFTLQGLALEDSYEGDFESRRAIIWTIEFIAKAYFYGPVRKAEIIKRAQVDIAAIFGNTSPVSAQQIQTNLITDAEIAVKGRDSRIVTTPGLLANGSPTTNAAASIGVGSIDANDAFGFAKTLQFYTDGKKYDPTSGEDV